MDIKDLEQTDYSDCSEDKWDTSTTSAPVADNTHCADTNVQQTFVKFEALDSPTTSGHIVNDTPKDLIKTCKTEKNDKFLSIADILFNSSGKLPRLKTEANLQTHLSGGTQFHEMHIDTKETPLASRSAYFKTWEPISPELLYPIKDTGRTAENTNIKISCEQKQASRSSSADEFSSTITNILPFGKQETTICCEPENEGDENQRSGLADAACARPSSEAVLGNSLSYSNDRDDTPEPHPTVTGFHIPRVPQLPGNHPMWLGQAIWRHMWHTRFAVTCPLTGVCLSPVGQGLPPVFVHSETRFNTPQTANRAEEDNLYGDAVMGQEEETTDINDREDALEQVESPDQKIDASLASPDLERSTLSPTPSQAGQTNTANRTPYEQSMSSRRRRRQRQAYSALQLSTLEGEFKVDHQRKSINGLKMVYREAYLVYSTVGRWVSSLKGGDPTESILRDQKRSGRPLSASNAANQKAVDKMILGNRRIKQKDIAKELEISKERAQHIITDILGYRKVSARWVPRMLTDEMKMQRKTTCAELMKHYEEDGEEFIQQIVTGDESWVHHYDPESKR
ncbi:histone-lysine n-methyltransferase setmar-like protein [Elysia marginata]|uniref:Histone-lysine n-methyltransferase setmar-like protein n=1 Tax=Elysia marginata TaxID=1093978 RepID=A0AAV4H1Z7_9GAST|nr:histone-lysine n-methyltransferase setmar-like protein [Elysia marginata]